MTRPRETKPVGVIKLTRTVENYNFFVSRMNSAELHEAARSVS